MKVTLYMAISADGFIATKDGDSDWVSEMDTQNFEKAMSNRGCVIMGRTTFEQYLGDLYPVKGITNIVLSSENKKYDSENVFPASSPQEAVDLAKKEGHDEALLIGGGKTSRAFLDAGLIDEMILVIHPLLLGDGMQIFSGEKEIKNLERINSEELDEGLIKVYYKVLK
ncbi:MAG: dihydrofolate reductase family protein [Candidatus Roizmanbacteria bacterium]